MDTMLTLVRHGQSIWNADGRGQGQGPIPLSELGHRQAERLAEYLGAENGSSHGPVTAFFCSDLVRCRQTAAPLAAIVPLPIQYDSRLREIDIGHWQGMTVVERQTFDPEAYAAHQEAFEKNPECARYPGGESRNDMRQRVAAALEEIIRKHAGGHVLMVTHGGPIRLILDTLGVYPVGEPLPCWNTSRTVLSVRESGDRAEALLLVDVQHLPEDWLT